MRFKNLVLFIIYYLFISCGGHFGGDGEEFSPPLKPLVMALSDSTSPTISFTENSQNKDVSYFKCSVDSGAWIDDCTSPLTLSNLSFGEHTVSVKAVNVWGMEGEVQTKTFRRGENPRGLNGAVHESVKLSDGSIVLGGDFDVYRQEDSLKLAGLKTSGKSTGFCITGSGFNGDVYTIEKSGSNYFVGGNFTSYNGVSVGRFVKLNENCELDSTFNSNIGFGFNNTIYAISIYGGDIYVGGSFTTFDGSPPQGIIKLNTDGLKDTTFSTNAGAGLNGIVNAISISADGSDIYVGGSFTQFNNNGDMGDHIVKLSSVGVKSFGAGTFNQKVGLGFTGGVVQTLYYYDGFLYAGGTFTGFNGTPLGAIAKIIADESLTQGELESEVGGFNDTLGSGLSDQIKDIKISNGFVYMVGAGNNLNGLTVPNGIYKFDTDGNFYNVFDFGSGSGFTLTIPALVSSFYISGDYLYVGGNFSAMNGITVSNDIVKLHVNGYIDDSFQINAGVGTADNAVFAIGGSGDEILIGGSFTKFGGTKLAKNIIKFSSDGSFDTVFNDNLGLGFNGIVYALAADSSDNIYVGGDFTLLNGSALIPARILKLEPDGNVDSVFKSNATSPGDGFDFRVTSLVVSGNSLYAGGFFTSFNGFASNRIIKMNLDATSPLSFSVNNNVYALSISGNYLYAGGMFTQKLARFDTSIGGAPDLTFDTNLGAWLNGDVLSLHSAGGFLYVGGAFTNKIYKINEDGTVAAGTFNTTAIVDNSVKTIKTAGEDVIIAGSFTGKIAKFSAGTGDLSLDFDANIGSGFDNDINSLLISDGKIYATGQFSSFDGNNRNNICRLTNDGILDEYFEGQGN